MAAATVNIPAISMNVGPMLNGKFRFGVYRYPLTARIRWQTAYRIWSGRLGQSKDVCRGQAQRGSNDATSCAFRTKVSLDPPRMTIDADNQSWTLQHHGYGQYDERSSRSPRHVSTRIRLYPSTIPRTRSVRLPNRKTYRRPRQAGRQAIRYLDQGGLRADRPMPLFT
jgi:hypothetical protein